MIQLGSIPPSEYKLFGPFSFTLAKGHNKIKLDECSSWQLIPKGSIALIRQSLSLNDASGFLAYGPSRESDFAYTIDPTGNIMLDTNRMLDSVLYIQLIMFTIPTGIDIFGIISNLEIV